MFADKRAFVNIPNIHTNETCLDVAVARYQLYASSGSDTVEFSKSVTLLLECGGKRNLNIGGKAVLDAILSGVYGHLCRCVLC